jgi:ribosomal protein S18 acetylase RimI-like enzyme
MEVQRQLTLIADVDRVLRFRRQLPTGYDTRETTERDKSSLASIYFAAYDRQIVGDLKAAQDEIERTFEGEYGQLDLEASPIATYLGSPVGSVMTVTEAPWDDTPPGPFIIEIMIHPDHQRRGLAEHLMLAAARRLAAGGNRTMALRVMSDNDKALPLYEKLGFVAWDTQSSLGRQVQRRRDDADPRNR